MKIFFGKIASKRFPAQFTEGYYDTDSKSWFNGIDVGDYAFAISGARIELWQARKWEKDGYKLVFDKIVTGIEGQTAKFIAFKYFKLFPTLISGTTKSLRNIAFVPIPLAREISESDLRNPDTYRKEENFRRILVLEKYKDCIPDSEDVQVYYDNGRLNIYQASFMEGVTFKNFQDNTDKIGGGRAKKDKTLQQFLNIDSLPEVFTHDVLNVRSLYEAFAVPYENKEGEEEEEKGTSSEQNNIETSMKWPLNQILYGPPGTGKTYKTLVRALAIIEEKQESELENEKRDDLRRRYEDYVETGQIAFITFHQSFGYEDFIEGIKPRMRGVASDNAAAQLEYEIKPGIFKQICEEAQGYWNTQQDNTGGIINLKEEELKQAAFYKMSLGDSQAPQDQRIYEYCLEHNCVALGWGEDIDFSHAKNEDDIKQIFKQAGREILPNDFGVFAIKCLKLWMKEGDLILIPKGNFTIRAIGKVTGDYFFDSNTSIGYNQFRTVEWVAKDIDLPIQQIYPKRFSMQAIYGLYSEQIKRDFLKNLLSKSQPRKQNYVLIIDEINRGNIAQIFGELITLIEEDKRLGKPEALKVKLPYSKDETFGVPPNLYIIGTMNTADRSVEALDTALRRRFSFEEMAPKPELLTPSLFLWNLLIRYRENEWDDEEYASMEERLINFLGADPGIKGELRTAWETFIDSKEMVKTPFSITSSSGLTLERLLQVINARIEKLLDTDHRIGHSYFINVATLDELKDVFYRKVIPLLQEYFYGDHGKIAMVLGPGFVQYKDQKEKVEFAFEYDHMADFEGRPVFRIIQHTNDADFQHAIRLLINPKNTKG